MGFVLVPLRLDGIVQYFDCPFSWLSAILGYQGFVFFLGKEDDLQELLFGGLFFLCIFFLFILFCICSVLYLFWGRFIQRFCHVS